MRLLRCAAPRNPVFMPVSSCVPHTCVAIASYHDLEVLTIEYWGKDVLWFATVLSNVDAPGLREVSLVHSQDMNRDAVLKDWAQLGLDEVLSRPTFRNLQRLTVCFVMDANDDVDQWSTPVQAIFPQCHAWGILEVQVEISRSAVVSSGDEG